MGGWAEGGRGETAPIVGHPDSSLADDTFDAQRAQDGVGDGEDDEAEGQAYAAIAEREVDRCVGDAIPQQDAGDAAERAGEEGGKAGGGTHEQDGEPAELAQGNPEEEAIAEGAGRACRKRAGACRGMSGLRHMVRIASYD